MAAPKKQTAKTEKSYWVIVGDQQFKEVTESELMENPREYLDKEIWDKPPNQYEIVISLKKIKK